MAEFSTLYPYILPQHPNVPEPAIDRAILDGAIQFCRDSLVWQETTNPLAVTYGQTNYPVTPVSAAEPIRILAAALSHRILDRALLAGADVTQLGDPTAYTQPTPRTAKLIDKPQATGELVFRIALEPKDDATTIPDELVRYWREPLAAAARFRLCLTYGDTAGAQTADALYQQGVARATAQATVGVHRGRLRTAPHK